MNVQEKLDLVKDLQQQISEAQEYLHQACLQIYPFHSDGVEYIITTTYSNTSNSVTFTLSNTAFKQIPLESASIKLLSDFSTRAAEIQNQIPTLGLPPSNLAYREKLLKLFNIDV